MDDVSNLAFQQTVLGTADRLAAMKLADRIAAFDSMIDQTFAMAPGADRSRCLHLNACVATELRRRDVSLYPATPRR